MDIVRTGFGKRPLKGLAMERKRVEEFKETLMKKLEMNQSCFTLGFLSQILSGSSLSFVGTRVIYTGVRMECKESGFSK